MIEPREFVPREGSTGLPYCFAPSSGSRVFSNGDPGIGLHHGHHDRDFVKGSSALGPAIDASRLQAVEDIYHNRDAQIDPLNANRQLSYHPTFKKSKVPQSEIGGIRVILFGGLGAISRQVLDFQRGEIRRTLPEERMRLMHSGELGVSSDVQVACALARFTVRRGLPHMTRAQMDKYKDCRWDAERKQMAEEHISGFLTLAFQPIE